MSASITLPFFVRGAYGRDSTCRPPGSEDDNSCRFGSGVSNILSAGFNTVQADAVTEALEALGARHLHAIARVGDWQKSNCRFDISDSRLISAINTLKANHLAHSAILAYHLGDEPRLSQCPQAPRIFAARTALVHSLDPGSRTFTVIPPYDEELQGKSYYHSWLGAVDLTGFDVYPCNLQRGCQWSKIDSAAASIEAAGFGRSDSPYFAILQDFQDAYSRLPTSSPAGGELRLQARRWVARGPHMSGIFVFSWNYLGLQLDRIPGNVAELAYDNSRYFRNRSADASPAPGAASMAGISFTGKDAFRTWIIGLVGTFVVLAAVAMILLRGRLSG